MKNRKLFIPIITVFVLFLISAAAAGGFLAGRAWQEREDAAKNAAGASLVSFAAPMQLTVPLEQGPEALGEGEPEDPGEDAKEPGETGKLEKPGELGEDASEPVEPEGPGEDGKGPGETEKPEGPGEDGKGPGEIEKPEGPGEDGKEPGEIEKPEDPGEDASEPVKPEEPGEDAEEPVFQFGYVVSKVTDYVNIRESAGTDSDIVGKLYKKSYAKILERGEEWTKVSSGKVTGYIKNDYLTFDAAALEALQGAEALLVEITAGTVNLRTGPGTDTEIIKEAKKGDTFVGEPESSVEGWTAVRYEGRIAYLSTQFVTEKITFKTAVSKAEEEEAAAKEALAKALEEAKKYTPSKTNRTAVELDDEDLFLLSIVIEMEAGSESYEGKLAVANVVINRLLSGKWGKTMNSVVYAPNQFSGANSGRIEKFSTRVSADSKKAAVAAAAGENNIGDYMFFIMKSSAKYSSYSKYYILGNHCFYAR